MRSRKNKTLLQHLTKTLVIISMLAGFAVSASAQQSDRGTITGKVTADQGQVVAFRVAAHNLDLRLWYTVFTNKGQYTVPQALPGNYEVAVQMAGYDSPKVPVFVAAGGSPTADLAIKKHMDAAAPDPAKKIEYVNSMDDIY